MFVLTYMAAELRRRRARTVLTALGLAVGVGLVVTVNALSTGLSNAQHTVLAPLTGVGTDMSVTRPLRIGNGKGVFSQLSPSQQRRLRNQSRSGAAFGFGGAKPGSKIDQDVANSSQASFSSSRVAALTRLADVSGAAGYLTLDVNHISGTVPKVKINQSGPTTQSSGTGQQGSGPSTFGGFGDSSIHFTPRTVTGIDVSRPSLAPVTPSQIVKGSYLTGSGHEALVSQSYANSHSIAVGDTLTLFGKTFHVVGISRAPLGATPSDITVDLAVLQKLAGYAGEVNGVNVRATSSSHVDSVAAAIKAALKGSSVTTASDLAKRVGGSLSDARNLSSRLGTALEIAGLLAAVLIACLLTLASVAKRVREIGTLKALGWSRLAVVRQISAETLVQGLLGGLIGAGAGIAAAQAINATGWSLKASVASAASGPVTSGGPSGFGLGRVGGQTPAASELVHITTAVSGQTLLLAVALALLGGLAAGIVGGLRAARLRPAVALRTID